MIDRVARRAAHDSRERKQVPILGRRSAPSRAVTRATKLELQIRERPHADTRQQDLIFIVRHRVADILVQQIVPARPTIISRAPNQLASSVVL